MSLKELSAEDLMVIYQQNSPSEAYAAFNELYSRFSDKVFSYLMKKIKNQADAEDLLQKVFIKVHESKHLYKNKFKFEQWLFVIARTAALDFFRSQSRTMKRMAKLGSPEDAYVENTQNELTSDELKNISEDQKEMLEMKFLDELSYREISSLLNRSETSVRKMLSRIMINLRKGDL